MERVGEMEFAERRGEAPEFGPEFRARLYDLLKWRRDVRRFKRTKLPQGTIERLMQIAAHRVLGRLENSAFEIMQAHAGFAGLRILTRFGDGLNYFQCFL